MLKNTSNTEPDCCFNCAKVWELSHPDLIHTFPLTLTKMFVCPVCGYKRCPKATDHRLDCTHSNLPGQEGSRYG